MVMYYAFYAGAAPCKGKQHMWTRLRALMRRNMIEATVADTVSQPHGIRTGYC